MKSWILVGLVVGLFAGCGSQKGVRKGGGRMEPKHGIVREDFDPLTLKEKELKIKTIRSVEAKSDYDDSLLKGIGGENELNREISGYRVQICAVAIEDTARSIQRDAIIKFNENVYLTFDSPYYKVRIGDFKTRYEAEQFQKLAIKRGFPEAWIIKTTIRPNAKLEETEQPDQSPPQP